VKPVGWIVVGGLLLGGIVAGTLLSGVVALLGVIVAGALGLLKLSMGLLVSLTGSALNVLFWGGAAYLGYRLWQRRKKDQKEPPWVRGSHG